MARETPPPVQTPLELCPLEVWSAIFDKLDCPTDVASCYRACREWMSFLKPNRTNFLMPEVFPLIVKHLIANKKKEEDNFDGSVDNSDWEDDDDEESVDGFEVVRRPIPNLILSPRLVCKSWKYAVDSFLQNHPYHTNITLPLEENPDPSDFISALPIKQYIFNVSVLDELEDILERDFPADCNPFLTRYVKYSELLNLGMDDGHYFEANLLSELRSAFTNLLELHGTHIWHASLIFKFPRYKKLGAKISVYGLVHRYLSLMPNLKTLWLSFSSSGCICCRKTPFLDKFIVINDLPKLEHLTTLKMTTVPPLLEKGMLLTNNHVKKLYWHSESISGKVVEDPNRQMDKLEEFTTIVTLEKEIRALQSFPWPLKHLAILSNLPLDIIFRAISASRFANNLRHLVLQVGEGGVVDEKLELPNLITFQIRVEKMTLKSIDFLLPTSASLCNLEIEMKGEAESTRTKMTAGPSRKVGNPTPNQIVQLDAANMLESNIWTRFPNLKYLKIVKDNHLEDGKRAGNRFKNEKYEYTREEWQKILKYEPK